MLGQCARGIVFREFEERAGPSYGVSDPKGGKGGYCALHRVVLQLPTNSFRTRLSNTARSPHRVPEFTARRVNGHEICSPGNAGQPTPAMLADGVGGNGSVAPPGSFGATTPPAELVLLVVAASDMAAPLLEAVVSRSIPPKASPNLLRTGAALDRLDLRNSYELVPNRDGAACRSCRPDAKVGRGIVHRRPIRSFPMSTSRSTGPVNGVPSGGSIRTARTTLHFVAVVVGSLILSFMSFMTSRRHLS